MKAFDENVIGGIGVLTREEREQWYSDYKCRQVCDDITAMTINRVVWLQQEALNRRFKKFIDLCCHDGFSARWLVDEYNFSSLVGIDLCKEAIHNAEVMVAMRRCPEKARYICGPYQSFAEDPGTWDGVSAFETIEHFNADKGEDAELLEHMWKMLRVGGMGYLSTPNIEGKFGATNMDCAHINLFSIDRLGELVNRVTGVNPNIVNYKKGCDLLLMCFEKA